MKKCNTAKDEGRVMTYTEAKSGGLASSGYKVVITSSGSKTLATNYTACFTLPLFHFSTLKKHK